MEILRSSLLRHPFTREACIAYLSSNSFLTDLFYFRSVWLPIYNRISKCVLLHWVLIFFQDMIASKTYPEGLPIGHNGVAVLSQPDGRTDGDSYEDWLYMTQVRYLLKQNVH